MKAVVIKEADGWTEAEARSLGTTENLREGSGTLKNVVEAVDSIGADGVAELAGLIGKVGPEELEAVLWGLKRRLGTDGASGGPAPLPKDGSTYDWAAAIAEERAKYNAKTGGSEGKLDSDQVLIETADGELKTLGEIEAEQGKNGLTQSPQSVEDVSRGDAESRSEVESKAKALDAKEIAELDAANGT